MRRWGILTQAFAPLFVMVVIVIAMLLTMPVAIAQLRCDAMPPPHKARACERASLASRPLSSQRPISPNLAPKSLASAVRSSGLLIAQLQLASRSCGLRGAC